MSKFARGGDHRFSLKVGARHEGYLAVPGHETKGDRLLFRLPSPGNAFASAARMPRIARGKTGSLVLHVLNRGNDRQRVFHRPQDYARFIDLLREGTERFAVRVLAFCIMPNHFHVVMQPDEVKQLSALMQWWLTSHVRRHHRMLGSTGHVWQGRFKSFPIQADEHLLTVLRYVLLNPVRARLTANAFDWPWSSLRFPNMVAPWPVFPPGAWGSWLADGSSEREIVAVRKSVERRAPFGDETWQRQVADEGGLVSTLRQRGRPRLRGTAAEN